MAAVVLKQVELLLVIGDPTFGTGFIRLRKIIGVWFAIWVSG